MTHLAGSNNFLTELFGVQGLEPLLPFLFVFAIIYGLLTIVDVFKGKKSVNVILALVFGLFAGGYQPFVSFFFQEFGLILWIFVILFFLAFALEVLGLRGAKPGKNPSLTVIVGSVVLLIALTVGIGLIGQIEIPVIGTGNFVVLLALFLMIFLFYYAFQYSPQAAPTQKK